MRGAQGLRAWRAKLRGKKETGRPNDLWEEGKNEQKKLSEAGGL